MSKKLSLPKDLQQARLDEKWTDLKAIFDAWAAKLTNVSGTFNHRKYFFYPFEKNQCIIIYKPRRESKLKDFFL